MKEWEKNPLINIKFAVNTVDKICVTNLNKFPNLLLPCSRNELIIMAHAFLICMTCCLFLPCNMLQICGFFSPYWMQDSLYRGCFRGVLYNVGCPDDFASKGVCLQPHTYVHIQQICILQLKKNDFIALF